MCFHVSLLRPYKGEEGVPPAALLPSGEMEEEVEAIFNHEDDAGNERFYYAKFIGDDVPSWKPEIHLQNCKIKIADYFKQSGKSNVRATRLSKRAVKAVEPPVPVQAEIP